MSNSVNMREPLVSVCIAAYNTADYLPETIASVQSQEIDNIEIVIVNDGSSDNTLEVALDLAELDERIRVIDQPNGGSCVARNKAFELARGRFICTLDSDDLWPAGKLKHQISVLEANPGSVVIGGVRRFRDVGGERIWGKETLPLFSSVKHDYLNYLLKMPDEEKVLLNTLCAPASYVKSDNWNPEFRTGHDWEVWIRLAKKYKFIHVPEIYQYYRKYEESTTRRNKIRMVGECQLNVISRHGPSVITSTKDLNDIKSRCALRFVSDAIYHGNRKEAVYFLVKALKTGAPFRSKSFFRLMYEVVKMFGPRLASKA